MTLLRHFHLMVIALVLLGIVGVCLADASNELLVVATMLTVLSWYVTEGPRGRTLPRWVSNLLVLAATANIVVELLAQRDIAAILGRFIVWLSLIKLYERRTARDHMHLLVLSLMLMLVACLQTQEMLFGIILIVYGGGGLYTLLLLQLYAAHEDSVRSRRRGVGRDVVSVAPVIGRHLSLQFRGFAIAVAAVGLILSSIIFVVFPRSLGRGMLANARLAPSQRVSGYSGVVDLNRGGRIRPSRRSVGEVTLRDAEGTVVRDGRTLRLRGATLDRYEGGRWEASREDDTAIESGPDGDATLLREPFPVQAPFRLECRFRDGTVRVFAPYAPLALTSEFPERFLFAPRSLTLRTPGDWPVWGYEVAFDPVPDESVLARLGPAPRRPPRITMEEREVVEQLAHEVLRDAGLWPALRDGRPAFAWEWSAAQAFANFLSGSEYKYSLDQRGVVRDADADPTAHFLLSSRRGHCEHFASGLALLCRLVDIDARVVSGYAVSEFDDATGRYVVRDADAHAWVEVRTGHYAFTTLDPSPGGTIGGRDEPAAEETVSRRLERFYSRLEGEWARGIVQFDERMQARLVERLDTPARFEGSLQQVMDWMSRVNRAFSLGPAGYIWLGLLGVVAIIAMLAALTIFRRARRVRRKLRLHRSDRRRLVADVGFYADMLDALERRGVTRPAWQPPETFARSLAAEHPHLAALARELTGLYYDVRFAGRRLTGGEQSRAREIIERIERRTEAT